MWSDSIYFWVESLVMRFQYEQHSACTMVALKGMYSPAVSLEWKRPYHLPFVVSLSNWRPAKGSNQPVRSQEFFASLQGNAAGSDDSIINYSVVRGFTKCSPAVTAKLCMALSSMVFPWLQSTVSVSAPVSTTPGSPATLQANWILSNGS